MYGLEVVEKRQDMFVMELVRTSLNPSSTLGKLSINGVFECYTLEDTMREVPGTPVSSWKVYGDTAIPVGTYEVIIDFSAHFGRMMPHITGVSGFDGIRMHSGNTDRDTLGCILLGQTIGGPDLIGNSRIAFDKFFGKLQAALADFAEPTITILNP